MSFSNTFLVEIDGKPLPADIEPLLAGALVDDSQRLPDMFAMRFRDPGRIVVGKTGVKVGSTVKISVQTADGKSPEPLIEGEVTALEMEFDTGGTFTSIRGYDKAHRLFHGRHTEAYTQMTASDIATKVAQRAGFTIGTVESTTTVFEHVSQAGISDGEFLTGLADEIGFEIAVREGKFDFGKPRDAADAPAAGGPATDNPLVLQLGADLLRFRSVLTSAEQVKEVEVRGWDVAAKRALTATAPAETRSAVLPDAKPDAFAKTFGDPRYVATDVPYRTQPEVDSAAAALADTIAGAFAEFEGVARGNPKLRARAAVNIDGLGSPFDGKYVITTSRHRLDPTTGYTSAFSVTGRQERSLLGLMGGGQRTHAPPGVVVAVVSDVNDPQQECRVKVTYPWLSEDYVSDWARTVQPGAGKNRGAMVLSEVGDEVLVAFEQGDVRRPYVLGGLYNGVDKPSPGSITLIDGSSGAVNRRSMVSRRNHRIDLLDQDGRTEGISLTTDGDKLRLVLDHTGTKVTVHSDGKVLVEGNQGIVIDAASSNIELKGSAVSIKANNGVQLDGGAGAVSVKTNGQLELSGTTAKLEGKATAELKGGSLCNINAAMVKIN